MLLEKPPRRKFADPYLTATGERRASVAPTRLTTLWFNTGTLCNIACRNCYIESGPKNDRLAYISRAEVAVFLDEARASHPELTEIGLTGGEPFMNPEIIGVIEEGLHAGLRVLVLTNAMKPLEHQWSPLSALRRRFGDRLALRVSLDHYTAEKHEETRGPRTWGPTTANLARLAGEGFDLAVAGRMPAGETEPAVRRGFQELFDSLQVGIDAGDPARLVLFPEIGGRADVPEISEGCWSILGKTPDQVMCASSRMVVKRRGAARPTVVACTLLPYDEAFEMGETPAEAWRPVQLNHPHCAEFCVLGGASCSAGKG